MYQNLDEAIRNEELEQDHLELHDCMKACIEVVASFQSVSNLIRSTLKLSILLNFLDFHYVCICM